MNHTAIKKAESIFHVQCENLLNMIHSDTFLLGGLCNVDGISVISSTNNIDELYFAESYYELLCDVPYEVEIYKESECDSETHQYIRELDFRYADTLYDAIKALSPQNIFSHIQETWIKERFSDAVCEDFSRFFEYFTISAYGESELKSNFLELQIEAYKSGCFPCGWSGTYPQGKIVYISS